MSKTEKITICPRCHSSNYYISNNDGMITGQTGMYVCNNCSFEAPIFPQMNLNKISKLKQVNKLNIPENIKSKNNKLNKINLPKLFIVLLLIFLTYTAYRFGLFDFVQSSHKHSVNFFKKYAHLK